MWLLMSMLCVLTLIELKVIFNPSKLMSDSRLIIPSLLIFRWYWTNNHYALQVVPKAKSCLCVENMEVTPELYWPGSIISSHYNCVHPDCHVTSQPKYFLFLMCVNNSGGDFQLPLLLLLPLYILIWLCFNLKWDMMLWKANNFYWKQY